jgi:hypothetical protein
MMRQKMSLDNGRGNGLRTRTPKRTSKSKPNIKSYGVTDLGILLGMWFFSILRKAVNYTEKISISRNSAEFRPVEFREIPCSFLCMKFCTLEGKMQRGTQRRSREEKEIERRYRGKETERKIRGREKQWKRHREINRGVTEDKRYWGKNMRGIYRRRDRGNRQSKDRKRYIGGETERKRRREEAEEKRQIGETEYQR